MNSEPQKVGDKTAALAAIDANSAACIDLDYEGGLTDILDLTVAGRRKSVSVILRTQEMIAVESLAALKRGLSAPKDTWRSRHLICMFELGAVPADDVKWLWAHATDLGDIIVPGDAIANVYSQHWKN